MTVPAVDELDPATVRGLIARASDPKRERWMQQVRRTGACRHPVRLRGVVLRGDERVYSTVDEPDGALMVRCCNRREACCPSCAHEYRGDMWQLVYAGMAGGRKGVPEQVAEHPPSSTGWDSTSQNIALLAQLKLTLYENEESCASGARQPYCARSDQ
jgi:hypothetical protein